MRRIASNNSEVHAHDHLKIRRWIRPYVQEMHDGDWNELSAVTIQNVIFELDKRIAEKRRRNWVNTPGRPLQETNGYVKPILQKVLKKMDEKGENLQLSRKLEVYQDIVLNPSSYLEYGARMDTPHRLKHIPKNTKNYADSSFLKNVYKTKKSCNKSAILDEEQKLYHGIPKVIDTARKVTEWIADVFEFGKGEINAVAPGATNSDVEV